ncbi:MAG: substrate-binding domain-containing protein [Eubacterium sp.]|nr:substrate-binding domain-containing protein [Eubacterium sp.]
MKRKIVAGIVSALMAASLLAGCGGGSSASSAASSAPAEAASSAASEAAEAASSAASEAAEAASSAASEAAEAASSAASEAAEATSEAASTENPFEGITANENYDLQIIVKAYSSTYWQALMEGANAAAEELGVTVSNQGPNNESDVADQVNMLNTAINNSPAGIGIASCDADSCTDSLNTAKEKGVPIIAFDSGFPNAPEGTVMATIATDSYAAGKIAGDEMWKAIKDKVAASDSACRVGYVGQDTVSGSHQGRGTGFIDGLCEGAAADGVAFAVTGNDYFVGAAADKGDEASAKLIIEARVPSQATTDFCQAEATALLNQPDIVGIFASGQMSSESIISANANLNKLASSADEGVIAIGFDAGVVLKENVANGTMYGAITQAPYLMGYYTVYALTAAANGETDKVVDYDCPAYFYCADNMNDEAIASNLYD